MSGPALLSTRQVCPLVVMLLVVGAWPWSALRAADAPPPSTPPPTLSEPPDEKAQADAGKLIHDLFGTQIDAAKTNIAKDELAKKLLQQGIDSKADPAGQFVLFKMARDYAVGVGDPTVALQSADETARAFRIDAIALRRETLAALAKTATNTQQSRALADAAWSAMDDAIAADNFDAAKVLSAQGLAAAKRAKDADVLRQWTARGKDIDDLESAYSAARSAIATLEKKPLDPSANSTVGHYRIFTKGDWDTGLSMIALGKESAMQTLAVAEMSPPDDPEAQLKLADGWWDIAESTQDGAEKERLQGRALYWYGQSFPNLTGLPKAKVEKRLQDVTARIFTRVQAAVRGNKLLYSSTVGPNRGAGFIDRPDEGGLLIGFEIAVANGNDGGNYIRGLRPIFLTSRGDSSGSMHGNARADVLTIRAHDGFAVGGITLKAANRIEGLSVTFMQIQGASLNPRNAYSSDWYGSRTGGASVRLGGSGTPIVGIAGKADNSLQELALMQLR